MGTLQDGFGLFGVRIRRHASGRARAGALGAGMVVLAAVLGLTILLVAPAFAEGAIRYVATTGSNELGIAPDEVVNDCVVPETPCLTIQHAIDMAEPGDTVSVAAGIYVEPVTVDKQITLQGDALGGTTIAPSAGNGIDVTGSGASATSPLVMRDLTVQGGTNGIYVAGGVAPGGTISYLTFDHITATASTGASGAGIHFNNTAAITGVVINESTFTANVNNGVRIATAVPSFQGLTVTNSEFSSNGRSGFSLNPSGELTNVLEDISFDSVEFFHNNTSNTPNTHEMSFFGFHGSATLQDVTVTPDKAAYGILFTNASSLYPRTDAALGEVVLDGVVVNGVLAKSALSFQYYSDVSNVSLTNVDISSATAPWGQFILDSTAPGAFPLGTTALKTAVLWNAGGVDATQATFLDASSGLELDRSSVAAGWKVADQTTDKIDVALLGLIRWKDQAIFVTPASYYSPNTSPSIQRGIDAATAGDTVHVKSGTYTTAVNVNKAVTLAGAKAGVAAGPAASPSGRSLTSPFSGETWVTGKVTISASDATVDGLVVDVAADHSIYASAADVTIRNSILVGRGNFKNSSDFTSGVTMQSVPAAESYVLENNWIAGGRYGIMFDGDANTVGLTATGNYFTDVERGIQTQYSAAGTVNASGNRFEDVTVGIRLARDGARILGNTFKDLNGTSTTQAAIRVASLSFTGCSSGASGITIAGNDVSGADYGVLLDDPSATPANPYQIVGNRFTVVDAEIAVKVRAVSCPSAGQPEMPASVSVDATGNWWGQETGPDDGQIADGGAAVDVSPYISSFNPYPMPAGDPGFWPDSVTLTAVCAEEGGCQEVAVVVNKDIGSLSIDLDLANGGTAQVTAGDGLIDPAAEPTPGDVDFATAVAKFIDIAVLFGGDPEAEAPDYFTVCTDGTAPMRLWHFEDPDDYPSPWDPDIGNDDAEKWVDITGRALPSGALTLPQPTGKLCGMVSSFSPFAVASTTVPTTTSITRTTGTSPSTYGSTLEFKATVTPSAGMAPVTGTVEFRDGAGVLGSCGLTGGDCTWSTSALGVAGSPYSITAYYLGDQTGGDDMEASNSTALSQAITAATLTVTPAAKSVTYGSTAPASAFYTFGVTGFKNSQTAGTAAGYTAPTCSSGYVDGDAVGATRTISCSGGAATNYSFSYSTATLTVTRATLTVTPDAQTITFGDAAPTYGLSVSGFQNGETRSGGTMAAGYSDPTCGSAYDQGDPAGSYTISCSGGAATNYSFSYGTATLTVAPLGLAPTETWYTGQRLAYTKGSSSTTAQVTLTASITPDLPRDADCFGASVTEGKVTFVDAITGAVLAKDVAIAEVDGNCREGIATAFATLSTGTYYAQAYMIRVEVSGSLTGSNDDQPSTDAEDGKTLFVSMPPTAFPSGLFGNVNLDWADWVSSTSLGSESSTLTDVDTAGVVNVSFGFTYGKRVLPKGSATIIIPTTVEGESYVIRTNSITSVSTSLGPPEKGVVYAKGNICRLTEMGCVSMEGNLSVRIDLTDYSDATPDSIGVTVQSSKSSVLYYSNDWRKTGKAWATIQAAVTGDPIEYFVRIGTV